MTTTIFKNIAKAPIQFYKMCASPFLAPSCRFSPTCSSYMLDAIEKHGVFKGLALGSWRILRCNPWNKCNHFDDVPETFDWTSLFRYKR